MPNPRRPWILSSLVLAALLFAGATATAQAQDWSRFRGPNGTGIVPDAGYPTEFGPDRNLKWRSAVRPGKSSPVLSARHIFLTAYDEGALFTQCFDRATGRLLWERKESPARHEVAHVLSEPAAATPVTDGENVYVFFRDFGVVSYDAAGTVRWKKPMGPFNNRMGAVASPIIAGSSLVLVLDQFEGSEIVALSLATGAVQWKMARHRARTPGRRPPSTRRRDSRRRLSRPAAACSAATRSRAAPGCGPTRAWRRPWSPARSSPATPMVGFGYGYDSTPPFAEALTKSDKDGDGRLSVAECGTSAWWIGIARYFGNRDGFIVESEWLAAHAAVQAPSSLVAVSLVKDADGVVSARELWRYEKSFVAVVPSPLVLDGLVYTIKNGGILTVLRADTGEVVKTGRVGSAPASYSASPVSTGGRIYFANEDGILAVVRAGKEWELMASNDLGEPLFATPALSDGRIYVRGQKSLFSFGAP